MCTFKKSYVLFVCLSAFLLIVGAANAQGPTITVSDFSPGDGVTIMAEGCGQNDTIYLFFTLAGAVNYGDFRLKWPFWWFSAQADMNGQSKFGPFQLPSQLQNFPVWFQLADDHPNGIYWSNVAHERWISEPVHSSNIRAIAPDGLSFADVLGSTVSIYDAGDLPNSPPNLMTSMNFSETIYDIDWGDSGILVVGNDASLGFIREDPSGFIQHDYLDDNFFPNTDFRSVAYVDHATAIVGGESSSKNGDYPVLFRWNYTTNSKPMTYKTSNVFSQYSRISTVSKSLNTAYFAAAEAYGDSSMLAVYSINQANRIASALASSQLDNISAIAISPNADWLVTAGDYLSNYTVNFIWSFNGYSLTKGPVLPISSNGIAANFVDGSTVAVAAAGERCFIDCATANKVFISGLPQAAFEVDVTSSNGHIFVLWNDLLESW